MALKELAEEAGGTTGNYGVQDQTAALLWVHNNIKYFGGDPTKVTIFGESAGGFSICWHLVSPATAGLFSAASTSRLRSANVRGPLTNDGPVVAVPLQSWSRAAAIPTSSFLTLTTLTSLGASTRRGVAATRRVVSGSVCGGWAGLPAVSTFAFRDVAACPPVPSPLFQTHC